MKPKNPITKIRRQKSTLLHREAEQRMRRLIAERKYRQRLLLPSEIRLAEKLGVSRHTLRLAIGRLVNEGLLVRTAGLGTRVCTPPVRTDVNAWCSFTREMERLGIVVENFEIRVAFQSAPAAIAERFGVDTGTPTLRLFRVRGWLGKPAVVADSWLHPRLGLTGCEDFSRPLYEVVQAASGLRPRRSVEDISVTSAEASVAHQLGVKVNHPILLRQRLVFDAKNQPIEFNINTYLPDSYSLHLELEADFKK